MNDCQFIYNTKLKKKKKKKKTLVWDYFSPKILVRDFS